MITKTNTGGLGILSSGVTEWLVEPVSTAFLLKLTVKTMLPLQQECLLSGKKSMSQTIFLAQQTAKQARVEKCVTGSMAAVMAFVATQMCPLSLSLSLIHRTRDQLQQRSDIAVILYQRKIHSWWNLLFLPPSSPPSHPPSLPPEYLQREWTQTSQIRAKIKIDWKRSQHMV